MGLYRRKDNPVAATKCTTVNTTTNMCIAVIPYESRRLLEFSTCTMESQSTGSYSEMVSRLYINRTKMLIQYPSSNIELCSSHFKKSLTCFYTLFIFLFFS